MVEAAARYSSCNVLCSEDGGRPLVLPSVTVQTAGTFFIMREFEYCSSIVRQRILHPHRRRGECIVHSFVVKVDSRYVSIFTSRAVYSCPACNANPKSQALAIFDAVDAHKCFFFVIGSSQD